MAEFEVTFVNVGQGDTTLIKLPGERFVLVDVRRCRGNGIDLFKLLDDVLPDGDDGRKRLDVLAITHAHDDHIAGIGDLYDRYQVVDLWLPQHGEKLQTGADNFADFHRVKKEHEDARRTIRWPKGSRSIWTTLGDSSEVEVRCFSPPGYIDPEDVLDEDEARRVVHENCVVVKFTYGGYSVMLTGDSSKPCWERIVSYYQGRTDDVGVEVLRAESLHASHHGSRTFVMDAEGEEPYVEALTLIDPEHVVISVGENSKYDHPHNDMLEIYKGAVGSESVLETRETGTIRLEIEADGVARLFTEEGPTYEEKYGWSDEDDGGDGDKRRRSVPPAAPPPGFEHTPQRGPRRDRYG